MVKACRSKKSSLAFLLVMVAMVVMIGCTATIGRMADNLATKSVKSFDNEVSLFKADLALFRQCLKERGGTCQGSDTTALPHSSQHAGTRQVTPAAPGSSPTLADSVAQLPMDHPAKIAHAVLRHPVVQQAAALHNHLRGHDIDPGQGVGIAQGKDAHGAPQSTVAMNLGMDDVHHFHHGLLSSLNSNAWHGLHHHCASLLKVQEKAPPKLEADCRRVAFVHGYLGAYTRNGRFLEVDVQLASQDQLLKDVIDQENKALSNVFRVSNVGFVSRDSTFRARLPTLEVTLDPKAKHLIQITDAATGQAVTSVADLNHLGVVTDTSGVGTGSSIGAAVVRVFLEAIFDAHEGLPAVAPANQSDARPTGLALGGYSLPLFESPMGHVDSEDLSRMTQINDQVATSTRAIMSRILAGIGPLSLNNQPLEDFIVEIISTSVRQATAKATWCWYACDLNIDLQKLESDAKTIVDDRFHEAEERVKRKAEQIKLRLQLRH